MRDNLIRWLAVLLLLALVVVGVWQYRDSRTAEVKATERAIVEADERRREVEEISSRPIDFRSSDAPKDSPTAGDDEDP